MRGTRRIFPAGLVGAAIGTVVGAAAGCARRPSPIPVEASRDAIAAIAGEWAGEYSSMESGRSGSIVFSLTAGRDTAAGDVLMVPRGGDQALAGAARAGPGGQTVAGPGPAQELTIRFVRVAGDSVSGVMDPYSAPECGCVLTTTFGGRVSADRIAGTFVTTGDPRARAPQTGRWAVTRRRP